MKTTNNGVPKGKRKAKRVKNLSKESREKIAKHITKPLVDRKVKRTDTVQKKPMTVIGFGLVNTGGQPCPVRFYK